MISFCPPVLWDTSGIRVFFFTRSAIPADIYADAPLPETWGIPAASFPASQCNPYAFMAGHVVILNTNFWYVVLPLRQ